MRNFRFIVLSFIFCCYLTCYGVPHDAALSVNIVNSLNNTVTFFPSKLFISDIVEKKELTMFEIPANREYLLSEKFSNFDQYKIAAHTDIFLREIEIKVENVLIGIMKLFCSKFCPDPFYRLEIKENNQGFIVRKKKFRRRGGPTTLEIIKKEH
ncbi:hypothetical protein BCR32DRAFT_278399 [Anaeromyces robustus]|uniref:Uncharacterized protein n=1 Tax=Anaeromyces robustus TaxID=1754192 RepID=A0A1Y1XBB8_9FUNG|nr:hypothetical protein BCR32DRAFT_278399 [Anaeromyces robustus]|eukprot:ORX83023.1 hypothetical protein BCR32DRAFT_278399 [Anaeromyces robustus]